MLNIFFKNFKKRISIQSVRILCTLSKIFPPVNPSCLKWLIHLWPSCPKTYSECLSWFIKLHYSLWVFFPAFCFSWNLCNFNSTNIVLMDLSFSLIIMLKKHFCRSHGSCMNSVQDRLASVPDQPSGLPAWRLFCTLTWSFVKCAKIKSGLDSVWLVWNWCE